MGEAPGGFIDYVRYPFVADGEKARRELGFEPRYTSRDALMAYLEYRYPETAAAGDGQRAAEEKALEAEEAQA